MKLKWHRIKVILLHSYYHGIHSRETWIDLVWFTAMQFFIFGFIAKLLAPSDAFFATTLMFGFFAWESVRIGQYCITVSVLWEIWSRSLSTMFISPLTLSEMMIGEAIAGTIKTVMVMSVLSLLSLAFFHFSLFTLGPMILVYFAILLLFAFAAGLLVTGIIFRYGLEIQSLAWGLIFIFQPFSGIYYSVDVFPASIRWLCYLSPITFVMEAVRGQVRNGDVNWSALGWGFGLALVYLVGATYFLHKMHRWSRVTGAFARLGN